MSLPRPALLPWRRQPFKVRFLTLFSKNGVSSIEHRIPFSSGQPLFIFAMKTFFLISLLLFLPRMIVTGADTSRLTIPLDGQWDLAQGSMEVPPTQFDRKVPVPGLVDMAQPPFDEVGVKSAQREAFWYRKVFHLDGAVPAVATLFVPHAFFGTRVYLNGVQIGEHLPLFTPGYFDLQKNLVGNGKDNELLIRVGAFTDMVPVTEPRAHDHEKEKYIPGIFDTVQLILSGTPNLVRVQAAPDIVHDSVHVQALVHNSGADASTPVTFTVKETRSGTVVGTATLSGVDVAASQDKTVDVDIPITNGHLWSPEDPFLYTLEVRTQADSIVTRFGLREFHFDPASGHAYLNGKPYFMRGTNVTVYRFFEDAARGTLPWNPDWVKRLHHSFKDFHWNSVRYCIGFPPEFWYDLADEEGILIQDEFPIWSLDGKVPTAELVQEYTEYMQDHWNHPSVVIWDAQNETPHKDQTGEALQAVRHLDLSNRPWDNGWGGVQSETDPFEAHPYHYLANTKTMATLATSVKIPDFLWPLNRKDILSAYRCAIIVNEYGGIWLQRDGYPTKISKKFYDHILGPNATPEQYRATYAHYMAADTEFWRGNRGCAAVLEFTALGYSRPDGVTSDHFIDVKNLVYDPVMAAAFKSAFAPVGLMTDYWETDIMAGTKCSIPIVVINDLAPDWHGTVTLTLRSGGKTLIEQKKDASVDPYGSRRLTFEFDAPADAGTYDLQTTITGVDGQPVVSDRAFPVLTQESKIARDGYPAQAATASSELTQNGVKYAAVNAINDTGSSGWSSAFSDPQWLAFDLGTPRSIGHVVLNWEAAYAKAYRLEVSQDGQNWTPVYSTTAGVGGTESVSFPAVTARWIRMYGTQRATTFGYFLWGFHVYPPSK